MKERDPVFDIMKGIAMISVIIIHSNLPWFSFHTFANFQSPLFFIISGYFAKEYGILDFFKKDAKKLVIPIIYTSLFLIGLSLIIDALYETRTCDVAIKSLLRGGASWYNPPRTLYIMSAGPLWFLWALLFVRMFWAFFCRIVKNEIVLGIVIFCLAIAAFVSKQYYTLPFSIQASLGALGFYYVGFLCRKHVLLDKKNAKFFPISFICLIYCICFSNVDINLCVYDAFYIIDVLGALAAFLCLYAVVRIYRADNALWKFFNYIGRYSLVALCIHSLDQNILVYWFPYKIWDAFEGVFQQTCAVCIRISIVLVGIYLISKNKFLCEKIFFIK